MGEALAGEARRTLPHPSLSHPRRQLSAMWGNAARPGEGTGSGHGVSAASSSELACSHFLAILLDSFGSLGARLGEVQGKGLLQKGFNSVGVARIFRASARAVFHSWRRGFEGTDWSSYDVVECFT
jgi:hypothetical protein